MLRTPVRPLAIQFFRRTPLPRRDLDRHAVEFRDTSLRLTVAIDDGHVIVKALHRPHASISDARLYRVRVGDIIHAIDGEIIHGPDRDRVAELLSRPHRPMAVVFVRATLADSPGINIRMERRQARSMDKPDGFLAAPSVSGIWNEPTLLAHRINANDSTLIQQLSSGHFGELWVGSLKNQRVAIKRFTVGDQNKANALAFASEIKLMAQLQHPEIAAFLGVEWTKEWQAQAVTELVAGGDLRSFLDAQHHKSECEWFTCADFKCQVAIDVVDALAYLHSRAEPVCMQTLKARNVLLDTSTSDPSSYAGGAKLSLYAVARSRPVLSAGGASDESSLRWLAPELAVSGRTSTDHASIYSFGVLLSELDTSRLPFSDVMNPNGSVMSSFKILQRVSKGELRVSLSNDCPDAIANIIRQCTAQDPSQRPSAAQLAFTLRDVLKNEL